MDQDLERKFIYKTIEKLNEYVRFLVRNKRMKQADSFCDEKYVQIATTGFFKKILAYFIEHDENEGSCLGADPTGIYEFVNEKLPGRVENVDISGNGSIDKKYDASDKNSTGNYVSINVEEGVMLKLRTEETETLAVTVCVPLPDTWQVSRNEEKTVPPDNDAQMPEPIRQK